MVNLRFFTSHQAIFKNNKKPVRFIAQNSIFVDCFLHVCKIQFYDIDVTSSPVYRFMEKNTGAVICRMTEKP